jgi:YidC/Oxa1 family membrane protein insertase
MKFYKENGINPLGGCLPLLAQLPVFWALFNVLRAIANWTPGHTPSYGMSVSFVESAHQARIFGISLYDQFLHPAVGESSTSRYLIVVFVLISAGTTFLTMRQSQKRGMMNPTQPDPDQPGAAAAQAMSKNMMYIAPFFALTGLYWQFGLVLYWVTTNIWTLGQQHFLFRSLPVVGSATVGASATQAASGTGAARNASGAAAKTGSAGKSAGTAKAGAAKSGTAAKTGTKSASSAKPASKSGTSSASGTASTSGTTPAKAPAAKANANGAAANGASANGSGLLKRFGKKEEEPQDVPVAPPAKVVRQQPVRQTRSKRGNTGKR